MAKANKLIFADAEKARDAITKDQQKQIAKLYEQWAEDIGKAADRFAKKSTPSSALSEIYTRELQKQLTTTRENLVKQVESTIKSGMQQVADNVVASNVKWLQSLGFPKSGVEAAFSYVPADIVERLATGQVYKSGWSLSKAIWSDSEKTMAEAYKVVAGGLAKQQSVYEIAKDLEKFVSPSAKKDWNLTDKDGRRIYPRKVDYAAQRLVRTLAQHSYQQTFQETTKDNPFITKYRWNANGSRACEICKERDGKVYDKDKLPMDHPNGMCVMEPVTVSDKEMTKQLADWVNGEDGDFPEIDRFAKKFGYTPSIKKNVSKTIKTSSKPASTAKKQTSTAKAQTTAQKATEPARQIVDGKNIVTTWERRKDKFDFEIEDTMDAQGFDGLPKIVSAEEFDEAVKKSKFIAQRSYTGATKEIADEYRNMLYNGKWYVDCSTGGAQYGQGMYCAADWTGKLTDGIKAEMKHYTGLGKERFGNESVSYIETMTLDSSAKVIDYDSLRSRLQEEANEMNIMLKKLQSANLSDNEMLVIHREILRDATAEQRSAARALEKEIGDEAYDAIAEKGYSLFEDAKKEAERFKDMNLGSYAVLQGYDAINAEGHGESGSYTVILNRTKLIIKKPE